MHIPDIFHEKGLGVQLATGLVFEVDVVWDTVTLLVCIAAVYFLNRLYSTFKGGELGKSYRYYWWAGVVLSAGLALRVLSDLADVDPSNYGVSIRDAAIIVALLLFAIGLRSSAKFWKPGPRGRAPGQDAGATG